MVERIRAVLQAAERQRCRVRRIRLPMWAYFELMCDFQDAGVPYPVHGDVARVCGVPILRDSVTESALEQLKRQLQPLGIVPVVH